MILVALQSVHYQQILIGELSELGYLVHTVSSGDAVIEAVQFGQYELIILDLSLPSGTYKRYQQALQDLQDLNPGAPLQSTDDFATKRYLRKVEELGSSSSNDTAGDGELVCEIRRLEQLRHKSSVPIIGVVSAAKKLSDAAGA